MFLLLLFGQFALQHLALAFQRQHLVLLFQLPVPVLFGVVALGRPGRQEFWIMGSKGTEFLDEIKTKETWTWTKRRPFWNVQRPTRDGFGCGCGCASSRPWSSTTNWPAPAKEFMLDKMETGKLRNVDRWRARVTMVLLLWVGRNLHLLPYEHEPLCAHCLQ